MRTTLSFAAYGVALLAWLALLWRAHGLGRDLSSAGLAADVRRMHQLRWIAAVAVLMLIVAVWL